MKQFVLSAFLAVAVVAQTSDSCDAAVLQASNDVAHAGLQYASAADTCQDETKTGAQCSSAISEATSTLLEATIDIENAVEACGGESPECAIAITNSL